MGPKRKKAEAAEPTPKKPAERTTSTRGKTQPDKVRSSRTKREKSGRSSIVGPTSGADDKSPVVRTTRTARLNAGAAHQSDKLLEEKKPPRGKGGRTDATVAAKQDKSFEVTPQKAPVKRGRTGISEQEILEEIEKPDIKAGMKRKKVQRFEDIEGSPAKRPALARSAVKVCVNSNLKRLASIKGRGGGGKALLYFCHILHTQD